MCDNELIILYYNLVNLFDVDISISLLSLFQKSQKCHYFYLWTTGLYILPLIR